MKRLPVFALIWALVLFALAAVIGGAGHNLMFPMAFTCSPFPVGYGPSLGLIAVPLSLAFWAFAAHAAVRMKPWVCPTLLSLQYAMAIVALALVLPDDFKDPNRTPKQALTSAAAWLIAWAVLYLAGQVTLWWAWAQRLRRRNGDYHRTTSWHPRSRPKSTAKRRSPKRARA